jgi:hypothetical protein
MPNLYIKTFMANLREKETVPELTSLRDRVKEWQQAESLMPYYPITYLAKTFGTIPRTIGPVLYSLGWNRKRTYTANQPSARYWVPPKRG